MQRLMFPAMYIRLPPKQETNIYINKGKGQHNIYTQLNNTKPLKRMRSLE